MVTRSTVSAAGHFPVQATGAVSQPKRSPRRRLLLDALYTFEAAARNPTFASAADELGVTASAVSHQIRRLEDHLDVTLFDRSDKRTKLTATGATLAQPLSELFGRMHSLVHDLRSENSTRLTVSVMNAFGSKWLAPRINKFCALYPDISVRLLSSDSLVDFHNDDVDVGIRFGAGVYSGLQADMLLEVEAFPVCSPSLASGVDESLDSLLHQNLLLHDESATRAPNLPDWQSWLEQSGIDIARSAGGLVFQNPQMAIEAALAGQGIALGLSPLVEDDIRAGRLVSPFDYRQRSPFSFWLVSHPDRGNLKKIRDFRNWILREARSPAG